MVYDGRSVTAMISQIIQGSFCLLVLGWIECFSRILFYKIIKWHFGLANDRQKVFKCLTQRARWISLEDLPKQRRTFANPSVPYKCAIWSIGFKSHNIQAYLMCASIRNSFRLVCNILFNPLFTRIFCPGCSLRFGSSYYFREKEPVVLDTSHWKNQGHLWGFLISSKLAKFNWNLSCTTARWFHALVIDSQHTFIFV